MNNPNPSFIDDLKHSEAAEHERYWQSVYLEAFGNVAAQVKCNGYATQRAGVDRLVYLDTHHCLYIEEKLREPNERCSDPEKDIALEYLSNDRTGAPGWIEKDLTVDFLAYAWESTGTCLLLPWLLLRRAWRLNADRWKALASSNDHNGFWHVKSINNRDTENEYTTISIAVPTQKVWGAIARASKVTVPFVVPKE